MNHNKKDFYGACFPSKNFVAKVVQKNPLIEELANHILAQGRDGFPVYVIREAISPNICSIIKDNFCSIINESSGDRCFDDYVSVEQIGATQFGNNAINYLKRIEATKAKVYKLFSGLSDAERRRVLFEDIIINALANRGIIFRPAQISGCSVGICTARSWAESGQFVLKAHEDLSQLSLAVSDGFEIGEVTSVIAYNLCVSNDIGGKLIVWNIDPALEYKQSVGLDTTGYPYEVSLLSKTESLEIDLAPGDAYFLRANYVHAVSQTSGYRRITIGRFMGISSDQKNFIYWT